MWGGKHTPLDFVVKGVPEHYRMTPSGRREVEKAIKELMNAEWIIITVKRTGKGASEHLSLNPRQVGGIRRFLEGTIEQKGL